MTDKFEVDMSEYLPLRDVVFKTLRAAILKGELAPGERLMEIKLANQLGVSRTPVREAIHKLEQEGLVLMIPRRGAEVAKISSKMLQDVLEVRRSLEDLAITLACRRMTPEQYHDLEEAEKVFVQAIATGDSLKIAESVEAYHDVIYYSTGNAKLVQILNNLREQMYRYRLEYIKDGEQHDVLCREHEHIMKTLLEKNIPEASKAIREHIDNQEFTVLKNLRDQEALEEKQAQAKKGKR